MTINLSALQKQRRDSAANWTAENPTLLAGEIGIESDTGKIKIGNGSSAWTSLAYQGIIPSSGVYPLSQLLMPSGTVSAPSISFDGDTNLGIYRSGTDQLGFTTAGTERMRLDSSGRLGLGTSSVGANLDIVVGSGTATQKLGSSAVSGGSYLNLHGASASKTWFIGANYNIAGALEFTQSTANGGTTPSSTPAMVLSSTGAVGIGTQTPGFLLDLFGSTPAFRIKANGVSNGVKLEQSSATGDVELNVIDTYPLIFKTSNAECGRWTADGKFLVGTSTNAPADTLFVVHGQPGNASEPGVIQIRRGGTILADYTLGQVSFADGSGNVGAHIRGVAETGWGGTGDAPGRLVFSTTADGAGTPTERYRITQDGRSIYYNTGYVYPDSDNTVQLGGPSNRFTAVYAVNGTIQTSDERAKTQVTDSSLGVDFIKALRPVSYKWIEGGQRHTGEYDKDNNWVYESIPGLRTHWGFLAQEVKEAVDAAGVDFGGWVLTDKDDPDSQQALRYDQFIAPLTKALQEALAKIETLEARLNDAGIA